jgi:hypothetical protein
LSVVNKFFEGMYRKKIQNPSTSDDLFTNILIINIVVSYIDTNKYNPSEINEKEIIDLALIKFNKLFNENLKYKNFIERLNTLIDRYLKEINYDKLL